MKKIRKELKNEKLEPCPFCSGKGQVSISNIANYNANESRAKWYFNIECAKCGIRQSNIYELEIMFCGNGEIAFLKDERKKAIDDWNMRKTNS